MFFESPPNLERQGPYSQLRKHTSQARAPPAPQFWILAICALVLTAIICISFLFTVVAMVEMGKASEKASEEINRTMDKANKEMQRSLHNIGKP